jgi:MinD superfamily P-loop ATPase
MHEILVISGKGGTGKTSITAALATVAGPHVLCDLDVDAPDLHLLLQPRVLETHEFWSGSEAVIDPGRCGRCGQCIDVCRFGAVQEGAEAMRIDPLRCEGCKTCVALCPEGAIDFVPKQCGTWYRSETRLGPMVHALLKPAEENSGRLVALLRKEAKELAKAKDIGLILSDGPPGIGCPVISALSGVHLALIVTEPTPSGHHDLKRVVELGRHFKTKMAVIVNKWDLSEAVSEQIAQFCQEQQVPVVACLPHDQTFVHAMVAGKTITEFADGPASDAIREAWRKIERFIQQPSAVSP